MSRPPRLLITKKSEGSGCEFVSLQEGYTFNYSDLYNTAKQLGFFSVNLTAREGAKGQKRGFSRALAVSAFTLALDLSFALRRRVLVGPSQKHRWFCSLDLTKVLTNETIHSASDENET